MSKKRTAVHDDSEDESPGNGHGGDQGGGGSEGGRPCDRKRRSIQYVGNGTDERGGGSSARTTASAAASEADAMLMAGVLLGLRSPPGFSSSPTGFCQVR